MKISKHHATLWSGIGVAFLGVVVSDIAVGTLYHVLFDFVGYAIHGAGLIPVYKLLEAKL